ncbi:MAG: FHA domain-containing protein [Planctomycetaceae bacterium]|jgi:hypothetical protein|nr:FHA domain-containing protein [Planctomycetaceae bacterium]
MYGELVPTGGGDNIPLLKNELVVGRRDDCDIVLRFSNISSRHCRLVLSDGYWYVQDMQSTNGVKVNGFRVDDRRIDPGAKLSISKHEYRINYDPKKLGATNTTPPDSLDNDIFSKPLLERAGLQNMSAARRNGGDMQNPPQKITFNYDDLTLDDISFD